MSFNFDMNEPGAVSRYFGHNDKSMQLQEFRNVNVASFNVSVSPSNDMVYGTTGQQVDKDALAFISTQQENVTVDQVAPTDTVAQNDPEFNIPQLG